MSERKLDDIIREMVAFDVECAKAAIPIDRERERLTAQGATWDQAQQALRLLPEWPAYDAMQDRAMTIDHDYQAKIREIAENS